MKTLKKLLSIITLALLLSGFMPMGNVVAADEAVTNFRLVDPITDLEVVDIIDGGYVNLARLTDGKVNIKAEVSSGVSSVRFNLDSGSWIRNEASAPYSLFGDSLGNYYATHTLTLGAHTLTATPYVGAVAGDPLTVDFLVVDDAAAPDVSGVTGGAFYNAAKTITFSDLVDPAPTATLDGNPFISGDVVSAEGQHTLRVWDHFGNSTGPIYFTIDTIKPVITLVGNNPMTSEVKNPFVEPGFEVFDANPDISDVSGDVDTAVIGSYLRTYTAIDKAGNEAIVKTRTVQVKDTVAPVVDAGADFPAANATTTLNATAVDSGSPMTYLWEKASGPGTLTFTTPTALTTEVAADIDGSYVISFTAVDGGQNLMTDTLNFVWDTTPAVVNAGADRSINSKTVIEGSAADAVSGVDTYLWEVKESPLGSIPALTDPNTKTLGFETDTEGTYILRLTVTDRAGNNSFDEVSITWDKTAPTGIISGYYLATGNGFVDVHWTNPVDTDFAGVAIYRSEVSSEKGMLLVKIAKPEVKYSDETVVNGKTYYYTIVSYDAAGNFGAVTAVLAATPTAPQLASAVLVVPTEKKVTQVEPKQEVKSETKEGPKEETKTEEKGESKTLPIFGIFVLVLLALVGIYLLYLQNPDFFKKLLKRRR